MRMTALVRVIVGTGLMVALCGSATAQDQPRPRRPRQDEPPLKGSAIREQRVPGVERGFSEGQAARQRGVPHRAFMSAIEKLRAADGEARVTPEQDRQITEIDAEYRASVRELARESAPRRPADQPRGEAGDRRPALAGPSPADAQKRIWAVLTPAQREVAETELRRLHEEQRQRQERAAMERAARNARPDGAPQPPAQPETARAPRERVRRIVEMLQQLEPAERERFLSRIEAELERRTGQADREDGERRPPPQQQPPAMDGVEVPPPDGRPR